MDQPNISRDILFQFLRHCVLFEDADEKALSAVADRLEMIRFRTGDPVVLENEISDHVYFVYSGSVEVVKHVKQLNQLTRLAVLKAGSQFSEFSVINRANKAASVFALEDCVLFRISGENFLQVLRAHPEVSLRLVKHIGRMHHHVQSSSLRVSYVRAEDIIPHPQIPQILPVKIWQRFGALPIAYNKTSLAVALKDTHNTEFINHMKSNAPLLMLYISVISEDDFTTVAKELAQVYSEPVSPPEKEDEPPVTADVATWLSTLGLFKDLPAEWLPQIAPHLTVHTFNAGDYLYKSGMSSDKFYMIQSGSVDLFLPMDKTTNAAIKVYTAKAGAYISENSLLNQTPHLLSARAATPTKVVIMNKDLFEHLLKTPFFTLPLARDLVSRFQNVTQSTSFRFYDPKEGEQVEKVGALLPQTIISQYGIMPLRLNNNELTIGITNPESDSIYSVISRYLRDYRVTLEIITEADFQKWYQKLTTGTVADAGMNRPMPNRNRGSVVEIFNQLLVEGFNNRSSDIHIEPGTETLSVRYRIDGVLREHSEKFSREQGIEIVSRIKVLSNLDMTKKQIPQDGQLKIEVNDQMYIARVSVLPSKQGETAVLRLIRQRNSVAPLATLVPDRRVINLFRQIVGSKQGAFLVTGPTGSGKSSTLYSLLKELNKVEVNIVSVEDPVEMEIAGTTQVEVNEKVGMTFAAALKSSLRQDPNVIMIGEIRDAESARIAFDAAMTGHLVISTLHTNDSLGVLPRLLELGVSVGTLATSLLGASAQRLVRAVCSKCREMRPATPAETDLLRNVLRLENPPTELAHGAGCEACNHSGYHGRLPIIEIWRQTPMIQDMILKNVSLEQMEQLLAQDGFENLRQFAFKMVLNGLTTVAEVTRVVGTGAGPSSDEAPKKAA